MAHPIPPVVLTGSPWHGIPWPDFDLPEPDLTLPTQGCNMEPMSTRTPDEILTVLDQAQGELNQHFEGRFDLRSLLWEVLEDIQDSVQLACECFDRDELAGQTSLTSMAEVYQTVVDYITNHYGDGDL